MLGVVRKMISVYARQDAKSCASIAPRCSRRRFWYVIILEEILSVIDIHFFKPNLYARRYVIDI